MAPTLLAALLFAPQLQAAEPAAVTAAVSEAGAGRYERALANWNTALAEAKEAGEAAAQAEALLGAGTAYTALGRPGLALERLGEAATLANATGDAGLVARVTAAVGNAELLAGRPTEARATLERALMLAEQSGQSGQIARVSNDLANLLAARGEREQAGRLYRQGLEQARRAGDAQMTAQLAANHARSLHDAGRSRDAAPLLALAEETARGLSASHAKSAVLISVARQQFAHGGRTGRDRATVNLEAAAAAARANGDQHMLAYALGYQAELYAATGQSAKALASAREAAHRAQLAGATESLYRWQWQTARVLREQGDRDGAITAYRLAITSVAAVRRDVASGGLNDRFHEQLGALFVEYLDLLLGRAQRTNDPAAAKADLEEARQTLELLKRAELADYFQDSCVAKLQGKTRGIENLAGGTAAIYPIALPDRLAILVSLSEGLRLYTAPVTAEALSREVRALRHGLEKRTSREYLTASHRVYDWLVRPLEADLAKAGVNTLVFVPDGVLRTFPLAALHDGKDYLVTRYAVVTSPGLSLTDPRPPRRSEGRLLVGALTESVQGFAALPAVADEVDALEKTHTGTVLANDAFRASRFESEIETGAYSIVHVASHGEFGQSAGETYLLAHDGRITLDELQARLGGSAYRNRPVELLALSACETAAGDDRAALGLAGVAVKAGVQSSLATLWSVSDRASTVLVSEFYHQLQDPALNKAQALQAAQQRLLADARYKHPAYWSPFLLIGNWL